MKVKVCGMREAQNIQDVMSLSPDYLGFIFYEKSKRYVSQFPQVEIPKNIKKVGVFVNESVQTILNLVEENNLIAVQLHGDESVSFCEELIRHSELVSGLNNVEVIKAFSVDETFDFEKTKAYSKCCQLFIFDTKGKGYGGTGLKYDWDLLKKYKGETPFLLSGGIGPNDVDSVLEFQHDKCIGVDLNSGFEDAPAVKNKEKLQSFVAGLRK